MARHDGMLFETGPEGLAYDEGFLSEMEETGLVAWMKDLPFRPFEFHGYTGNRRVVSFGWSYDYAGHQLRKAQALPPELSALAARAAAFAGRGEDFFAQALVTEYAPGAGIGWHRDKKDFGEVAGLSLLSSCRLRFRRRRGENWQRHAQLVRPRSIYLLRGAARHEWEHSIPAVSLLRYSITFRSLSSQSILRFAESQNA